MDLKNSQPSIGNNTSEPSQAQIWQTLAEMKAELNSYKAEVSSLREQLASSKVDVERLASINIQPSSRRKMLKQMVAGAAGVSALSLAALAGSNNNAQAAATAADNAIEATPGGGGYAGKFNTGGLANIYLAPASSASFPAPATGETHVAGELFVDSTNSLYYCITGGTGGTSGTSKWRRLAGPNVSTNVNSGSFNFLDAPVRIVDTTSGVGGYTGVVSNAGSYGSGGVLGSFVFTVAESSITIPAGITGIVGVIQAVNPTTGGNLKVLSNDATTAGRAAIVIGANNAANQFFSRVDSNAKFKIVVVGAPSTYLMIDLTGYYV